MLCSILGGLGAGKTLLTVILAYYQSRKVISNFHLELPSHTVESFEIGKFTRAEYEDCVIIMDEAYAYLESRISGTELNRIMSYILFQSRKKNVELFITAQLFSSIDKRFRELSDIVILAERDNEQNFCYTMLVGNTITKFIFNYEIAKLFFEFYNTNEVISTTNPKFLYDMMNSEQKDEYIRKLAKEVKHYYSKQKMPLVTEDMVNLYAEKHDVPKFIRKSIFTQLKLWEKVKKSKEKDE